ncbi:Hsp20/alpha crystallin family protein [Virgibacillus dakarensis]|uniref:Hsp20/alpha crystallin family protein n=1 Tax=Virgibacillus dakarensis TaxID=1917889 RepID=UPI0013564BED|nr:Hsp20/alpha crystallin family protein [Virgibacillus dakarensis]MBT2217677.1 Hsp20/alpha crystallin family protein [Virgibacillus dakarensis]
MSEKKDNQPRRFERPQFNHLLDQIDSFFNDSLNHFNSFINKRSIRVNMRETKSNVIVEAELPGYKRDQIQLEIIGNQLRITAEDTSTYEEKNDKSMFYNKEHSFQRAERLITLPFTVSEKDTKAALNNGILKITIPKKNESRKFIDINDPKEKR